MGVKTSRYFDLVGSGDEALQFRFESCKDFKTKNPASQVACLHQDETLEWFRDNQIVFMMYQSTEVIDYSSVEDYVHYSMEFVSLDAIRLGFNVQRYSSLRIHEVSMQDTLFDPFNSVTDEHRYLSIIKSEKEAYHSDLAADAHNI